jgi:hypothetical protein
VSILYRYQAPKPPQTAGAETEARVYLLSVKYPHVRAKPGFARVELIVEGTAHVAGAASTESLSSKVGNFLPGVKLNEGIEEAWVFEVSQMKAKQGLEELRASGFFSAQPEVANSTIAVIVESNQKATAKYWNRVASLDRLINQVRQEGKLVSHTAAAADFHAMMQRAQTNAMVGNGESLAQPTARGVAFVERLPAVY